MERRMIMKKVLLLLLSIALSFNVISTTFAERAIKGLEENLNELQRTEAFRAFIVQHNFLAFANAFKKSLISIEDKNFYYHNGFDYKRIAKSLIENTIDNDIKQGASTITQQVARLIYLSNEKTYKRKVLITKEQLENLVQKIQKEII